MAAEAEHVAICRVAAAPRKRAAGGNFYCGGLATWSRERISPGSWLEVGHSVYDVKFQSDELKALRTRALLGTAKHPPARGEPIAGGAAFWARRKLRSG